MVVKDKNKLKASSIIEVVIAMTIIAIVVAIGSMTYVNINQSNSTLKEINEEGEVLSRFINQRLVLGNEIESEDFTSSELTFSNSENESFQSIIYKLTGRNKNTLWQFEVLKNEDTK
jgi:type II secretory pathway component PulJ